MQPRSIEQRIFWTTRILTLGAVVASILGAFLMFYLGGVNTVEAFMIQVVGAAEDEATALPKDEATVIALMDALDRFLIGMVLLFFGFGVYGLFIRPDCQATEIGLPDWMHVERIGQLKQTLAEVILVVLFVLFLRVALQTFHGGEATTYVGMARFLLLPVSIVLLAAGLRLAQLHPKETTPPELETINSAKEESDKSPV